jgi:hypothetical protein
MQKWERRQKRQGDNDKVRADTDRDNDTSRNVNEREKGEKKKHMVFALHCTQQEINGQLEIWEVKGRPDTDQINDDIEVLEKKNLWDRSKRKKKKKKGEEAKEIGTEETYGFFK